MSGLLCRLFGHDYVIPVMRTFDPIWCRRCGKTIYPIEASSQRENET